MLEENLSTNIEPLENFHYSVQVQPVIWTTVLGLEQRIPLAIFYKIIAGVISMMM